ncbi:MAG: ComF family protein [Patescibacteria group bacterium]|nr:ComF family protein [Patescibacteria group bacterium]
MIPINTATRAIVDKLGKVLVSFLFPRKCVGCRRFGSWLCPKCEDKLSYAPFQYCLVCGRPAIGGFTHPGCATRYSVDRLLVPFQYQGPLRLAICRAKYWGEWALFSRFADLVSLWLAYSSISFLPDTVLVPIPLHPLRLWERGFNQSEIFAKYLAQQLDLSVSFLGLKRAHYTQSQTKLNQQERKKNVRGAFSCSSALEGKNIVLVDDVCSTGATLSEASKMLKKKGARSVWVLVIAHGGN